MPAWAAGRSRRALTQQYYTGALVNEGSDEAYQPSVHHRSERARRKGDEQRWAAGLLTRAPGGGGGGGRVLSVVVLDPP